MAKERQMSPTLDGIRDDHKQRYQCAMRFAKLKGCRTVLDVGCGVGYGAYMMAQSALQVTAFDQSSDAIDFALRNYIWSKDPAENPTFYLGSLEKLLLANNFEIGQWHKNKFDLMTCFEILEHTRQAGDFLEDRSRHCRYLIGSVPNEEVVPFEPGLHHYHVRHYTAPEIRELLTATGWDVKKIGGQVGKQGADAHVNWNSHTIARCIVFRAASRRFEA